jgi:sarcosine oxidase subunit beta
MAWRRPITWARTTASRNVAIIEKGWLGGGNTGRNTTIIRSNYLQDPSAAIYNKALTLYETLSQDLNYNVMFSPRGLLMLAQTHHEVRGYLRTVHANNAAGRRDRIGSPRSEVKRTGADHEHRRAALSGAGRAVSAARRHRRGMTRWPGAMRGPVQRWGWTSSRTAKSKACGPKVASSPASRRPRASSAARSWGWWWPGIRGNWPRWPGFRLPIEAVALQALVSEPIKPCMDVVVMANTVHGYMSQSDKGEMVIGGGTDGFNNYTQRGSFHHIEETLRALVETFPIISR